jgi:serine/threonine protein kinase
MGQVYEARHIRLGRRVALKILRSDLTSEGIRMRFEREARAAAQIEHEQVVSIFDFGMDGTEEPYLVMQYLEGSDLRAVLREQGPLAAPRAVRLLYDACLGLEAAHARSVIHRDIKPENLFVIRRSSGSETCKVLDFGLAKLRAFDTSELQTAAGVPFGTLHYMSPEQARGDDDIDERTDVYACSAVLYEMLTGQRPHAADTPHALLYKITHETPRRIEEHSPWLPPGLADVVHRGLEKDRAFRPTSIEVFRKLLEPFLGAGAGTAAAGDRATLLTDDTQPDGQPASRERHVTKSSVPARDRTVGALLLGAVVTAAVIWIVSFFADGSSREVTHKVAAATVPERVVSHIGNTASVQSKPHESATGSAPIASVPLTSARPLVPLRTSFRAAPRPPVATRTKAASPTATAPSARAFDRQNPYDD